MAEVKQEKVFKKVSITLVSYDELRAVVSALGRMSIKEYREAIAMQYWKNVDAHKLDQAGSDLYHQLDGLVED